MRENRVIEPTMRILCDLGVGGERGVVYDSNGIIGALSATQYKDAPKVMVMGIVGNIDGAYEKTNRVWDSNGYAPSLEKRDYKDPVKVLVEGEDMRVNELGFMDNGTGQHQSNTVYGTNGIVPAITTIRDGGTQQIKIMEEPGIKVIGQMDNTRDHTHESANRIYDTAGCSPSLTTCGGGGLEPKIMVASRGRNPENPNDRSPGIELEQRLEPNEGNLCNTLTSVYKDNMVLEAMAYDEQNECARPDGTVGTLTTDGSSPKHNNRILIKQATEQGYIECEDGGIADFSFPDSKKRRGRVQEGGRCSPDIPPQVSAGLHRVERPENSCRYRIRKLTPRSCWRLMGFKDEEFDKAEAVNSNTRLYEQAGNSIVVDVLVAIFKEIMNAEGTVNDHVGEQIDLFGMLGDD